MKRLSVFALAALATLAAPPAHAEDVVHTCIAASTEGQTLRKDGKLLSARAAMLACARDVCPAVVRSHCARWLTEVDAQIPSIVVRAQDGAGNDVIDARVAIDGRPGKLDGHPVRLDPGEHTVSIDAAGGRHREERMLVAEGESSRLVTLRFAASPADAHAAPDAVHSDASTTAPSNEARSGGGGIPAGVWILGGAGVLSLGASAVFALSAKSDLDGLDSTCSPHCTQSQTQPGRTRALLADVFLGAGAVAVSGAVVWALVSPSHAHAAPNRVGWLPSLTLAPVPGGAAAGLRVSY